MRRRNGLTLNVASFSLSAQLKFQSGFVENIDWRKTQSFDLFIQGFRIAKIVPQFPGSKVNLVVVDEREKLAHDFTITSAARGEDEARALTSNLATVAISYS